MSSWLVKYTLKGVYTCSHILLPVCVQEVAKLKVAVLTHATNQRCIKLSKVAQCIVVTTHLEQRDDNITQLSHTI